MRSGVPGRPGRGHRNNQESGGHELGGEEEPGEAVYSPAYDGSVLQSINKCIAFKFCVDAPTDMAGVCSFSTLELLTQELTAVINITMPSCIMITLIISGPITGTLTSRQAMSNNSMGGSEPAN